MFAWNSPYVLAVILGLLAVGLFHFDQQKKKLPIDKISYIKVFILVAGSVGVFYYFVSSQEIVSSVLPTNNVVIESVKSISPSPSSAFVPIEKGPAITNTATSLGGLYGNLKIREGPPNF
jgi:hypothetical protein